MTPRTPLQWPAPCLAAGAAMMLAAGLAAPSAVVAQEDPFVLRVAAANFGQEDFDPASGPQTGDMMISAMVYDTLLDITPDGSIAAGLAVEWSMDETGSSWTFRLREGVPWHDGQGEVTAEDVKFSLERLMHPRSVATSAGLLREQIDAVEVVDSHTVRIHTRGRQPYLPFSLSPHQGEGGMVLNAAHARAAGDDFDAQRDHLNAEPVGSGPFRVVEHRTGDMITYEAVDTHWRNTPEVDRIELMLIPEAATQVAMLFSGEADIIELSPLQLQEIAGSEMEVRGIEGAISASLVFSQPWRGPARDEPTADARVREALSLAIDRQTIIDNFLMGRGSFPSQPHIVAPTAADLDTSFSRGWTEANLRYDPDAARDLLAEAGYPDGLTIERFFAFPRPGLPFLPSVAEMIEAMWRNIGVSANIVQTDWGSLRSHVTADVDPEDDYAAGMPFIHTSAPRFIAVDGLTLFFKTGGPMQQIKNDEFDRLIDRIPQITDDAERMDAVTRAVEIVYESWTVPPLFNVDALFAVNPETVGNWTLFRSWPYLSRSYETIRRPG